MIVIKVELHSAVTGKVTEIGRMNISNDTTGTDAKANYIVRLLRRGTTNHTQRLGSVTGHARHSYSIWVLVAKALNAVNMWKDPIIESERVKDVI